MLATKSTITGRPSLTAVGLLGLGLIVCGLAFGQIKSGVITGIVTDSNGAVVPKANVSVINQETNIATTAVTDETGNFTVPYLEPGTYTVNVEKPGSGFSKYSRPDLTVSTAQTVNIDVILQNGTLTETIVVRADAATLQTSNATVGGLVNELTVQSLPNITHNPFTYATLQAGVVPRGLFGNTQSTQSFGIGIDGRRQASAIGINGGSAFSNDIILDGVSIQGSAWNETAVLPNQDALQEVKIITNNYSAEYGRAQGVVLFTTKGGSNEFHGSGFYRIRNEALNANSFFNNANGIARGPFKSNTFGGTAGGRIIRDKTFFFVSYEGLRFHQAYDYLMTVPTLAERNGDFSNTYVNVGGRAVPVRIYDPFNATRVGTSSVFQRVQFPTFTDAQGVVRTLPLPPGRLNQFGMAILTAYPAPNRTPDDIFNRNNFFFRGNQPFTKNNINSRVDHHWGNHSFYGTYGFQRGNIMTPRTWGPDNQYYSQKEFVGNQQPDDNYYFAFGDTVVLSSSLIIDARVGLNRIQANNEADVFADYNYNLFGIPKEIQAINVIPGAPPATQLGTSIVSPLNNPTSLHKRERQTNTDFNASMTWTHGRWNHKFGGTYRVLLSNYIDVDDSSQIQTGPEFTRSNINADGSTGGLTTPDASFNGLSTASILLGAGSLREAPGFTLRLALAQKYYGFFTQNDWRVNDRLTVNLGLRWDVQPGPTDRYDRLSSLNLNAAEPLFGTPGAIVFPGRSIGDRHAWQTDYKDFGPRLGAAYQLNGSLVVRGGYGLTYVPSNTGFNDGPGFYGAQAFTASVVGFPYGPTPAGVVIGPFNSLTVDHIVPPVGADPSNPAIYGGVGRRLLYNYKNGYVQQWNLFLEQKVGKNWIVSAGYLGSHGSRLQVAFVPINSPQLIDPALLASWRDTYIASNGATNPSTQQVPNPFQPATGPLIPYGAGNIRNRTISRLEASFPFPLEGNDQFTRSSGISDYNALQLQVTRQFANGLQLGAHYTFSKQMAISRYNAQTNQGYSDGGNVNYFANLRPDLQKLNRQITTNDVPHRLVINWVYDLPLGKGKRLDTRIPAINSLIGGWRVSGSLTAYSGFVFPISNGGTNSINNLPDRVSGVPIEVPKALQHWYDGKTSVTLPGGRVITPCNGCFLKYNIDAFAGRVVTTPNGSVVPDLFWYGTSAPTFGDLRSNSVWNTNLSLSKSFKVRERYSIEVAAQATNLLNHPEFKPGINTSFGGTVLPSTVTANPSLHLKVGELLDTTNTFGTYTRSTYDPRQIEFVAKVRF